MRLCEGKSSTHEWISQKTYKPPKRKKPARKSAGHFGISGTQKRWLDNHRFFTCKNILFILYGRCQAVTSPSGQNQYIRKQGWQDDATRTQNANKRNCGNSQHPIESSAMNSFCSWCGTSWRRITVCPNAVICSTIQS